MNHATHPRLRRARGAFVTLVLLSVILSPAWSSEGTEPSPIPRTKGLDYYLALVNTTLPSFTSAMLTVPNGPDWMAGKTVHAVAIAVQDSDPGTIVSQGPITMGYDPPDGPRYVKLDFSDGYIRYTNQNRSFHVGSPCVAVPMTEASGALAATAGALGVPTTEWDATTVDTVMERGVSSEAQDPTPETVCETERMATMTRKAPNGYPIFDSKVRASVSNLHERARLLIDWPRFLMQTGLILRTRTEVVTDLAQQILQAEGDETGLGAEVNLEIRLGYARTSEGFVPVARAAFLDIYDRYAGRILNLPLALNPSSGADGAGELAGVQLRARFDPAAGRALVDFALPQSEAVRLTILDVSGREVAILTDATLAAGSHQSSWDLQDRNGRRVPSGVYFARLEAGGETPTRKLIVVR